MRSLEQLSTEQEFAVDVLEMETFQYHLIVWNDEINTFEWVIKTLMDVCAHDKEQAEQCTIIIHYKGKCSVKTGEYDALKILCDGITDRGIGATIEELVM